MAYSILYEPYHEVVSIPSFIFHFKSENVGEKGDVQNFEYLENEKNLTDEIKSILNFLRLSVSQI